jgi:hypothetical protein
MLAGERFVFCDVVVGLRRQKPFEVSNVATVYAVQLAQLDYKPPEYLRDVILRAPLKCYRVRMPLRLQRPLSTFLVVNADGETHEVLEYTTQVPHDSNRQQRKIRGSAV